MTRLLLSCALIFAVVLGGSPQAEARLSCMNILNEKIFGFGRGPSPDWKKSSDLKLNSDGSYSLFDLPVEFFKANGNPVVRLKYKQDGIKFRPTQHNLPNFRESTERSHSVGEYTRKNPVYAYLYPETQSGVLNVVVMDGHHRVFYAAGTGGEIYVEIFGVQAPEPWHILDGAWDSSPVF